MAEGTKRVPEQNADMKGIILAGGHGKRLGDLTKITNKHLLPVYDKPMIYYPLKTLLDADIKDIFIVSGPEHAGHFLRLLGSGKKFNAKFTYEIQDEAGGIAQALSLAEDFADNDSIAVILGDNIFEDDLKEEIKHFKSGAKVFLKEVENPERFGVPEIKNGRIVGIEEKPKNPKTNYCVTGLYIFDNMVFDIIKKLKPSNRGELEITDVNNQYTIKGEMAYSIIKGSWTDAGTLESLYKAATLVRKLKLRRKTNKTFI